MEFINYKALFISTCLSLSLIGCGGSSKDDDSTSHPPVTNPSTAVSAVVKSAEGALLKGVKVSVFGKEAYSDANGIAKLNVELPKTSTEVVVTYEAQGFIKQAILVKVEDLVSTSASLMAEKEIVPVEDIAAAQTIQASTLGTTIKIPANGFVKANGSYAQGKVNVHITPWDIRSSANDLNAMPANGQAIDSNGERTQLISAGMITATFIEAATGEKLQLASNKTADIQMDLPLTSINNQKMTVGTEIPMWHFEESKGLWVEEGKGTVISSASSSTGLAVHANVKHFSTWNWDFKFEAAGSVFIQCVADNNKVPCNVIAKIKLADGSLLTKTSYISEQGTRAYNMPSEGTISWQATDLNNTLLGEETSLTTGSVTIDLGKPTTDNFVKCVLPNGAKTPCTASLNQSHQFSITEDGAKIVTGIKDDDGQLEWSAVSPMVYESNQWIRYKGKIISGLTGAVTIQLTEREVLFAGMNGLSFYAVCTSYDLSKQTATSTVQALATDWQVDPNLLNKPCEINLTILLQDTDILENLTINSVYGQPVKIQLPSKFTGFYRANEGVMSSIGLSGEVKSVNGKDYRGYADLNYRIAFDEVVIINLWEFCTDDTDPSDPICEIPLA